MRITVLEFRLLTILVFAHVNDTQNGRTALHLASFVNEDLDVVMRSVHLLLQYGALTDIQDKVIARTIINPC